MCYRIRDSGRADEPVLIDACIERCSDAGGKLGMQLVLDSSGVMATRLR